MKRIIDGVEYYDVPGISERIGIGEQTVAVWCRKGRLRARKMGGRWWASEEALGELFRVGAPVSDNEENRSLKQRGKEP